MILIRGTRRLLHDQVVLHEREIRKQLGAFGFFRDPSRRASFLAGLNDLITEAPFTIVAAVTHKERYLGSYTQTLNPYHIDLGYCLERLYRHRRDTLGCTGGTLHVVFEGRGKAEDQELEPRRACEGHNRGAWTYPFQFVLASKRGNSTGLQLADLVARPIGLRVLRPEQPNRAWDLLGPKLRRSPTGVVRDWGLKVFLS